VPLAPWQVWWIEFDPHVGPEQAGRRPAIIVGTPLACALPNRLAIVVPCTTTERSLPWHPPVTLAGRSGFAMCDQVKSVSIDRLVDQHKSGAVEPTERDAIAYALSQMIVGR